MLSYTEPCSGILSQVEVTEMDRRLFSIMYTIKWIVNNTNPMQPRVVMKMKILFPFSDDFGTEMFDEKFVFIFCSLTDWFLDRLFSIAIVVPFRSKYIVYHISELWFISKVLKIHTSVINLHCCYFWKYNVNNEMLKAVCF